MKKLLAILGSVAIGASSASTVVACTNTKKPINQQALTNSQQALTNESLDSIKPLVMADQYGLALDKTNETIDKLNNYPNKKGNFANLDNSVAQGMNLDGLIGKDNAPLYPVANTINSLLGKIGVGPIDFTSYLDSWGGLIKEIPNFINEGNITGLMGLIPVVLQNVVGFIPKGLIGPETIKKVSKFIKDNITSILSEFNLNYRIADIINANGGKASLATVTEAGSKALVDLTNRLFSKFKSTPGFNSADNAASAFLGTQILTPLLNGKSIDKDVIKNAFDLNSIFSQISDLVNDAATFLASVLMRITIYMPLVTGKNDDDIYKTNDAKMLTFDSDKGDVQFDGKDEPISFNDLFKIVDLLSDTKQDDASIFKLTGILFHNSGDQNSKLNPLLSVVTNILIDSLKFTDYKVSFKTSVNIGVGDINVDINFALPDLFKKGNEITLVDPVPTVVQIALWAGSKNLSIIADINNNGLVDNSDYIANLLEGILVNRKITSDTLGAYIKAIIGKGNDGLIISEKAQVLKNVSTGWIPDYEWTWETSALSQAGTAWGVLWGILGGKLTPILDGILGTMWYTDGDKFFKALVSSGFIKQDAADAMRAKMKPFLPLATFVLNWMKNSPIGDITKIAGKTNGLLNIDAILNIIKYLFLTNPIQDPKNSKQSLDASPDDTKGGKSLIEEILETMNDDNNGEEWNYYLGYESLTAKPAAKDDVKAKYVQKTSFMGQIVEALYPLLDGTKGIITSDNWINLRALSSVQSDVMDALDSYMTKLAGELEGKDLTYIIKPLLDDPNAWKISDVKNIFFDGSDELQKETYLLTFDSSSANITGETAKSATYKITFSRIDKSSKFSFDKIEKVIKK